MRIHNKIIYQKLFQLLFIPTLFSFQCTVVDKPGDSIVVAAASNLQFALKEIGDAFQNTHGTMVTFVWGASGSLAEQIRHGAPYDLYVSANETLSDNLYTEGFFEEEPVAFLEGQIVLGVLKSNLIIINDITDLNNENIERVAIASPVHAPFGIAAQEALQKAGIWYGIQSKLIFAENIRQCMQFVSSGNTDLGIVSGHLPDDSIVKFVPIDRSLYSPIFQTVAIVKNSQNTEQAHQFKQYIQSEMSDDIFNRFNYTRVTHD